jgi:hypothetical protein
MITVGINRLWVGISLPDGSIRKLNSVKWSYEYGSTIYGSRAYSRANWTLRPGGCKKFCVNGQLLGNCRHFERSCNGN